MIYQVIFILLYDKPAWDSKQNYFLSITINHVLCTLFIKMVIFIWGGHEQVGSKIISTLHMIALFFMLHMENKKVYSINKINFDKHPKTSLITLE